MKSVYVITREENWGTRFPRKYHSVYIMASSKTQAVRRFNKHLDNGHEGCLKVSTTKLPITLKELHGMFSVEKLEVLYETPQETIN